MDTKTISKTAIVNNILVTPQHFNDVKLRNDFFQKFIGMNEEEYSAYWAVYQYIGTVLILKSGVKVRVMYNLRHTFASQLISNGADIVYISKTLGYKDVSITLKIYTKFIKEEDAVRLEKMKKIDKFMVKFENDDQLNSYNKGF